MSPKPLSAWDFGPVADDDYGRLELTKEDGELRLYLVYGNGYRFPWKVDNAGCFESEAVEDVWWRIATEDGHSPAERRQAVTHLLAIQEEFERESRRYD